MFRIVSIIIIVVIIGIACFLAPSQQATVPAVQLAPVTIPVAPEAPVQPTVPANQPPRQSGSKSFNF